MYMPLLLSNITAENCGLNLPDRKGETAFLIVPCYEELQRKQVIESERRDGLNLTLSSF